VTVSASNIEVLLIMILLGARVRLVQFFSHVQSFSPGASAANLRGLGVNSTLVLIDGHRQVPYPFPQNGTESFVDLNSIPLAAVDRIEILKDGASATYFGKRFQFRYPERLQRYSL
jgi:outer membrane receptor protein involved in Fe transport